jgi:tripartite-type tricarboxylate transporter receptor subunit TctC
MYQQKHKSLYSLLFLAIVFQFVGVTSSFGQFPYKTITIVNSNNPGGVIDLMARKLAVIAKKYEDVTIIIENIPGGSGTAAMNYVLNQPADGYTLLATLKSYISTGLLSEDGVSIHDFHLLACMVYDWEAVITNKNSEVISLEDILIDAERKNGRQRWLGPNTGGMDHLMALKTWEQCNIQARWIPFEGSSVSIASLLGGNGVAYVGNPLDTKGRPDLNIAAIASPNRLADFPDVPTFREKGFDIVEQMWRGFSVKQNTPAHELEFLENLLFKISQDPEWISYIKSGYAEPVFLNNSDMVSQLQEDEILAKRLLTKAGIISETKGGTNKNSWLYLLAFLISSTALIFTIYKLKKKVIDRAFYIHIILIGLPLYFLYQSSFFPGAKEIGENGPALIPRIWSSGLLIFSLLLLFSNKHVPPIIDLQKQTKPLAIRSILLLVSFFGCIFLLGFYISAFLFIVSILWILNYKRYIVMVSVASSFLLVIYLLFEKALNINLPNGIWL